MGRRGTSAHPLWWKIVCLFGVMGMKWVCGPRLSHPMEESNRKKLVIFASLSTPLPTAQRGGSEIVTSSAFPVCKLFYFFLRAQRILEEHPGFKKCAWLPRVIWFFCWPVHILCIFCPSNRKTRKFIQRCLTFLLRRFSYGRVLIESDARFPYVRN